MNMSLKHNKFVAIQGTMKKLSVSFIMLLIAGLMLNIPVAAQNESDDDEEEEESLVTGSKYGEDSVQCVMNLSLYYEFYKQWKQSDYKNNAIKDAIGPWRWVFNNCPVSSKNIYVHGIRMMDYRIQNAKDKETREKFIDTLMMVYDQRIKYFGREGYNLGRKGVDLYKLRPSAYEEAYNILKKSVDLRENKTQGAVLIYYFRAAEKMVKSGKEDTSLLVDIYDQASEIIEYNLDRYEDNQKKQVTWENIQGNIELSFEPYATCKDLINTYKDKFNANPNDVDLLKKITKILDKKKCTDSDLFFQATENLHKAEPTAKSAYLMGKMYIKKDDYTAAAKYLEEATSLFEDEDDLADAHYLLANVHFQLNRYSQARSECYKALNYRPGDGNPYILIGDMYAASAKSCGDNDLTDKVAYWAAVDKYIKAKSVDPSVAETANSRINTYSQHFPATETIFFYDLKKGESYKVGCWINETTTVRSSD